MRNPWRQIVVTQRKKIPSTVLNFLNNYFSNRKEEQKSLIRVSLDPGYFNQQTTKKDKTPQKNFKRDCSQ